MSKNKKIPHFAYEVPSVERRDSAKWGIFMRFPHSTHCK
nr:MAG TPA: hypothetical protein [Caudoviricetes sp.]